jgi:hypothetical protein
VRTTEQKYWKKEVQMMKKRRRIASWRTNYYNENKKVKALNESS